MRLLYLVGLVVAGTGLLASGCAEGDTPQRPVKPESHRVFLSVADPLSAGEAASDADRRETAQRESDPAIDAARTAGAAPGRKPLRILVIGAHPADVFDQSGGTMAHHVGRGDWVGCVIVTHGARVHDKVVADEMFHRQETPDAEELKKIIAQRAEVKTKEIIRACAILGVAEKDVYFLGADDAVLLVKEAMIRQLARLLRKLRPNVVITHFPLEDAGIASQHATTGHMVMHAIEFAAKVEPGDKSPPHRIAQVFFFGIGAAAVRTHLWGSQGGFHNDVFVDITDVAAKKVACLDAIASQGYGGAYARKRIEFSDGAFGSRVKVPYAEGFITLHSTTHYYLPVSEIDLEHAKASDHEAINRGSRRVTVP